MVCEISVFFTKIVSHRVRVGFFFYNEVLSVFSYVVVKGVIMIGMNHLGWTRDSESLICSVYQLSQVFSTLTFEILSKSED